MDINIKQIGKNVLIRSQELGLFNTKAVVIDVDVGKDVGILILEGYYKDKRIRLKTKDIFISTYEK